MMQVGLLWFDNDPRREVAAKALDAARRYREKFGVMPDTCYVNSAALGGREMVVPLPAADKAVLRLRPAADICPHHFWVGVEDTTAAPPAAKPSSIPPLPLACGQGERGDR